MRLIVSFQFVSRLANAVSDLIVILVVHVTV